MHYHIHIIQWTLSLYQDTSACLHDGWSQTIGSGFVVRCDWSVPDPALATRELRMIEMMSYDIIVIVMMS